MKFALLLGINGSNLAHNDILAIYGILHKIVWRGGGGNKNRSVAEHGTCIFDTWVSQEDINFSGNPSIFKVNTEVAYVQI